MSRLLALAALFLSACVGFTPVGPGPVSVKDRLQVTIEGTWNRFDGPLQESGELWTADGLPLDTLIFYPGIADGEALAQSRGNPPKVLPKFRSSMGPSEIVELMESYATADGSTFKLDKLAPAPFAGGQGFRYDFRSIRKGDEVEMRGIGYGIVQQNRLYLLLYRAPLTHYFQKHLARVEAIAASVSIKK